MPRQRDPQPNPPSLRFRSSLSRLGLGIKPPPPPPSYQGNALSTTKQRKEPDEDEWYIPYNGPVELPPNDDGVGSIGNPSTRSQYTTSRDGHTGALGSVFGGRDHNNQMKGSSSLAGDDTDVEEDESEEIVRGDMDLRARFGYSYTSDDEDGDDERLDHEISFHSPLQLHPLSAPPVSASHTAKETVSRPRAASSSTTKPGGVAPSLSAPLVPIPRRATVSNGSGSHSHGGIGEAPMPITRTFQQHPVKSEEHGLTNHPSINGNVHVNPLKLFHPSQRDTYTSSSFASTSSPSSPPTTHLPSSIFTASPPQTYSAISSPPGTAQGTVTTIKDSFGGGQRLSLASLFGGFKGKGKERERDVEKPKEARQPRRVGTELGEVIDISGGGEESASDNVIVTSTATPSRATRPKTSKAPPPSLVANGAPNVGAGSDADVDADYADADSEAYYDTYYATLLSTPTSAYASTFKTGSEVSPPPPPLPLGMGMTIRSSTNVLPMSTTSPAFSPGMFGAAIDGEDGDGKGGRGSPRIDMGGFGKHHDKTREWVQVGDRWDAEVKRRLGREDDGDYANNINGDDDDVGGGDDDDDERRRQGNSSTIPSSSRQAVHPYANVRAFTFPSTPREEERGDATDQRDVDGREGEGSSGRGDGTAKSRPPKLTFTAPSQHSSPLTGHPHTHPNAHLHLQTHPFLSPPSPPDNIGQHLMNNDGNHSPPRQQAQMQSPSQTGSPLRTLLLPHPLQHLHQLRSRLKFSMSTPNLRASAASSSSLSAQSSRSSIVSPNSNSKNAVHSRKRSKSKIFPTMHHQHNTAGPSQSSKPGNAITQKSVPSSPHTGLPRGLDRWLSAETWCDALFLPKPRLKIKGDQPGFDENEAATATIVPSRRIVSPPGSPIARDYVFGNDGLQTLESRVLAHSRSLADLRLNQQESSVVGLGVGRVGDRKGKGKAPPRPATADAVNGIGGKRSRGLTLPSAPGAHPVSNSGLGSVDVVVTQPPAEMLKRGQVREGVNEETTINPRPARPKSWALDDLALPSPVPSLMTVLAEGQILEHQRRKWQAQAQKSFQNERSRSLSRSRSKSVTKKANNNIGGGNGKGQGMHGKDSKLEYLAARAVLGNQNILPISTGLRKRSLSQSNTASHTATDSLGRPSGVSGGSTSHRPSHSLSKTISKSSHSRNNSRSHSRNGSWSKTALNKIAQGTAVLCGIPGGDSTTTSPETEYPRTAGGVALEGALKSDHTQVIRLPDPASLPLPGSSPSPTYGYGTSSQGHGTMEAGEGVGIAISTPTPSDCDRDSIHLPDHPYAQTVPNAYHHTYTAPSVPTSVSDQRHELKNSSTSLSPVQAVSDASLEGPSTRVGSRHPYAHLRDSYQSDRRIVGHPRPDSSVTPQATMWAPISPGVVREVLPEDIRYSPLITSEPRVRLMESGVEVEDPRVKALAYARNSRNIFDTVALGETLAMAVESSRDSGVGTSEEFIGASSKDKDGHEDHNENIPRVVSGVGSQNSRGTHREAVKYDATRPMYRQAPPRPSPPLITQTPASSTDIFPDLRSPDSIPSREASDSSASVVAPPISPGVSSPVTSESSSPHPSPRPLGHMSDDLEHFRDLFYRPDTGRQQSFQSGMGPAQPSSSHTSHGNWEGVGLARHRTASSGLTSLVRQVSEELEELTALAAGAVSEDSASSRYSGSVSTRRDSDRSNLRFVVSELPQPVLPLRRFRDSTDHISIQAFRPSTTIPEDVESSHHGSLDGDQLDPDDEDATERFRIGTVEALPTPPSLSYDRRFSQHLSSYITHPPLTVEQPSTEEEPTVRVMSTSSLHPSTLLSRTSFMTSSDGSRMSGLSDFPVPPLQDQMTPGNMSVINSYFEDVTLRQELSSQTPRSRQAVLPGDEEVDFAMALSSRPPTARPQS